MANFKLLTLKKIVLFSLIYLVFFLGYGYYAYTKQEQHSLDTIHKELLHGALSVPLLLGDSYHERDFEHNPPTREEDYANIIKLSQFVHNTNLAYIYSFIQEQNGTIIFTSSSATQKELDANESDLYSFDTYEDNTLAQLFSKGKINEKVFVETHDKWGNFLSVYVLLQTPHGRKYIVGADYKHQDLTALQQTIIKNILYFITFIAVLLILSYLSTTYSLMRYLKKELKKKTKALRNAYEVDPLTKLQNKNRLFIDLKQIQQSSFVAIVDIEKFSMINDVFGYNYGDKYLIHVAMLLQEYTQNIQHLKLYKLDIDMFCFLCEEQHLDLERFESNIESILTQIAKHKFKYNEYESSISLRAGIADVSRKDNPLMHAEIALKYAKQNRLISAFYTEIMDKNNTHKQILDDINYALDNAKVYAYFQPIYDLHTKSITRYESLMRIQTKNGEIAPPQYFLPLAKKTLLYKRLSDVMIEKLIQTAQSHPRCSFSFNLSSIDIENKEFMQTLLQKLSDAHITHQIIFEILESEEFKDFNQLLQLIQKTKELGIRIAIDDFGSGYSNIANTIELDIDYLKIDGSLVRNVLHNQQYEKILKSIINFAHEIGAKTIAEFVENKELANKMNELGVDMLQGYYIAKPSPQLFDDKSC